MTGTNSQTTRAQLHSSGYAGHAYVLTEESHAISCYDFELAGPRNPRGPQDFAQIRVASDK
jgi:hypothetical protein